MYASQFSQTSTPSLKANFCIFLFSSILTIMPERIISQKAVSFCPSEEIVAIFLKKDYPGLRKPRTLKHKIILLLWKKSIHCRKTWPVTRSMITTHCQAIAWSVFWRKCLQSPQRSSSPTVCSCGQVEGSEMGCPGHQLWCSCMIFDSVKY